MSQEKKKKAQEWVEFECPECDAHNPWSDGFSIGDNVVCMFCGTPFLVKRQGDEGFRLERD